MDTMIIGIYCLCDDYLKSQGHQEDRQRQISDAEVMTIALVASYYYKGNYTQTRWMLQAYGYIRCKVSKGCYSKRSHRVRDQFLTLFRYLASLQPPSPAYIMDSFPIIACDNIRIRRCRLYQGDAYRGYVASKQRYFYGLRLEGVMNCEKEIEWKDETQRLSQ